VDSVSVVSLRFLLFLWDVGDLGRPSILVYTMLNTILKVVGPARPSKADIAGINELSLSTSKKCVFSKSLLVSVLLSVRSRFLRRRDRSNLFLNRSKTDGDIAHSLKTPSCWISISDQAIAPCTRTLTGPFS
jgi:hypothetical protein